MQGHYDGQLAQLTKRHQQRQKRRKGPDERTIITGQRLPEPGEHTSPYTVKTAAFDCLEHKHCVRRLLCFLSLASNMTWSPASRGDRLPVIASVALGVCYHVSHWRLTCWRTV